MAIRNNKLGGQDWDDEILFDFDLNDTFDAVINKLPSKAVVRNSYIITIANGSYPNDEIVCVDVFRREDGLNSTVDTTNTNASFYSGFYSNSSTGIDENVVCNISIKNSQSIVLYVDCDFVSGDTLNVEISDGINSTGLIDLTNNSYNFINLSNLDTSLDLTISFTLNSSNNTNYLGSWTNKANMPTGRLGLGVAVVNDKIYAIGGNDGSYNSLSINEEYNPATNTWTTKANMPYNRTELGVVSVNGKIYAIGGRISSNYYNTNYEYDPSSNTWTTKASMSIGKSEFASSVVNDKIYCIGGTKSGNILSTNYEYDPSTNSWTTKSSLPTPRKKLTSTSYNNKIYVIGGDSSNGTEKINEVYDPATDTWTTKANMLTAKTEIINSSTLFKGEIYVVGGYNGSYLKTVEVYNPKTNVWYRKTDYPYIITKCGLTTVNDKMYCIGGGYGSTVYKSNREFSCDFSAQKFYGYSIINPN